MRILPYQLEGRGFCNYTLIAIFSMFHAQESLYATSLLCIMIIYNVYALNFIRLRMHSEIDGGSINMKRIEYVDLKRRTFILNYRHETSVGKWKKFHAHQGVEFLWIHKGNGHIYVNNKSYTVHSNTLVIFQPYQLHCVQINLDSETYIRTVLNIDPEYLDMFLKPFPLLRLYFRNLWKGNLSHPFF